jgi:NAD(P)-dependent dehydrogenase (short-subunit alcohol dehydrogenase family)
MRALLLLLLVTVSAPLGAQSSRRVVLITGSTDGLGREVALRTAATGATVLIHGRNQARGDSVVALITARGQGRAQFYAADLASFEQVRQLAAAVQREHPRLDILVNNAGIFLEHETRTVGAEGHELHFTVNYLSGFLLTRLLLPTLTHDGPARIINVASRTQQSVDFADVMLEQRYSASRAYGQSKLAQITFTMDLAAQLRDTRISVVAVHPASAMATNLVLRRSPRAQTTVADGADAVMALITAPSLASGSYFFTTTPAQAHAQAYDPAAQQQLRSLSERLTAAAPLAQGAPRPRRE